MQRLARPAVFAFAVLVIAIAAAVMFRRATTPWASLPDNDYWDNIRGIITEAGVSLDPSVLLRHNNEHIVVIPKLVYATNYLVTSGSNIGLIVYSLVVGTICSALLLFLARDLLVERPWRFGLCALLFPLVMFSPKLAHSYFLGMSGTIWLTADLFVILSAAALARAAVTGGTIWLVLSLLTALLGVLSYSTAVYSLLVLLLYCLTLLVIPKLRGATPRIWLIGIAAVLVTVLALGLIYREQPEQHPTLAFDLIGLIRFVLVYLGNSVSEGPLRTLAGLAILVIGVVSIAHLAIQGRAKDVLLWIILFMFAPFNALMTGIGRLGFGLEFAASSRYQSVTALSLIATIALALFALPNVEMWHRRIWIGRGLALGVLLLSGGVLASNLASLSKYTARNERKVIAEIALRQGIQVNHHLEASTRAIPQLDLLIPALRASGHVPFHRGSECEAMIGQHIAHAASAKPVGAIETISMYERSDGAGSALEISGWAERDGSAAKCVVIIDGNNTVIGSGSSILRRRETGGVKGRSLEANGWQAVATLPRSMPICALALFSDSGQWALHSNHQASVEMLPLSCQSPVDMRKSGGLQRLQPL